MLVEVIKRSYRRRKVGEQFEIKDKLGKVLVMLKKVKQVSAVPGVLSPRAMENPPIQLAPPASRSALTLVKFNKDGSPRKPRGPNKKTDADVE